jgi:hypothetical protein
MIYQRKTFQLFNLFDEVLLIDLHTIVIPKYKQICHIELPSVILNGEEQWIETIIQSSLTEIKRNRSVLIICETRMNAKTILKTITST